MWLLKLKLKLNTKCYMLTQQKVFKSLFGKQIIIAFAFVFLLNYFSHHTCNLCITFIHKFDWIFNYYIKANQTIIFDTIICWNQIDST